MAKLVKKKKASEKSGTGATVGRKRDPNLDGHILEAALATLGEIGFDNMTMDQVAARAGSAKTTVYRRWPSKAELVRDALIWMSRSALNTENIPDTGTLRGDLLGTQKSYSPEHSERKIRVLSKLGSFNTAHQSAAEEVAAGVFGPSIELNSKLMKRAIDRGEFPKGADVEMICQMISAAIAFRTSFLHKPFDKAQYAKLLDTVILPALRGAAKK